MRRCSVSLICLARDREIHATNPTTDKYTLERKGEGKGRERGGNGLYVIRAPSLTLRCRDR